MNRTVMLQQIFRLRFFIYAVEFIFIFFVSFSTLCLYFLDLESDIFIENIVWLSI